MMGSFIPACLYLVGEDFDTCSISAVCQSDHCEIKGWLQGAEPSLMGNFTATHLFSHSTHFGG